jgi:uncharacterized membrane protein
MTLADKLNLWGIAVTFAGSAVAMCGAYLQVNGYFAIKTWEIPIQIVQVLSAVPQGRALELLRDYAKLGEVRKEDRAKSLLGFFLVLLGFLLQTIGAALMATALFANGGMLHTGG